MSSNIKLLRKPVSKRKYNRNYTAKLLVNARYCMAGIDNKHYSARDESVIELLDFWLEQWLYNKYSCPCCGSSKYP